MLITAERFPQLQGDGLSGRVDGSHGMPPKGAAGIGIQAEPHQRCPHPLGTHEQPEGLRT